MVTEEQYEKAISIAKEIIDLKDEIRSLERPVPPQTKRTFDSYAEFAEYDKAQSDYDEKYKDYCANDYRIMGSIRALNEELYSVFTREGKYYFSHNGLCLVIVDEDYFISVTRSFGGQKDVD